ncbi:MAG: hypothetical protein JWM62_2679 [Frankiales bacterium]|nr:hypothetical protein [Frankiales bacterium]
MTAKADTTRVAGRTANGIGYDLFRLDDAWAARPNVPVVLQHGLGLDRTAWNPWVRRLLATRTVVTVDLRGHGDSADAWADGERLTLEQCTADLLSVLEDCSIGGFHYVGESFGGTLGLYLAGTHQSRVASVTACSTGWRGEWFHNIRAWSSVLSEGGSAAWSDLMTPARFDPQHTSPALVAWVEAQQRGLDPAVVWAVAECLLATDLSELLPTISAPVLTMLGDSPFVDQRNLIDLVRLVPRADAVRVAGARHGIVLSHWEECLQACLSFLNRVERHPTQVS